MDDLDEVVGQAAGHILRTHYAGRRLRVPTLDRLPGNHPIVELIGLELAVSLCKRYGGDMIQFPSHQSQALPERNAEIRHAARVLKVKNDQLAKLYRLHIRTIQLIVAD